MAAPVMAAMPAAGNLLAAQSLAASANVGVLVDASAQFEAQVDVRETTGATAASTSGVSVAAYHVYAQTTTTGTSSANGTALSIGATTVTVSSAVGIAKGQKIAVGPDGSGGGEVVTASAISSNTLTISATLNAHANGAPVYLISQTPPVQGPTLGQNLTAANTSYGSTLFLQTATWFLLLTNTDASNAVTVEATSRAVTGVS